MLSEVTSTLARSSLRLHWVPRAFALRTALYRQSSSVRNKVAVTFEILQIMSGAGVDYLARWRDGAAQGQVHSIA